MKVKWLCLFLLVSNLLTAKVYDCFMFFNEHEILKTRLAELDPVVDYFVIVESEETFQGRPKPLYFKENEALYAPYLPKIIHVVQKRVGRRVSPWFRESAQRNGILKGIQGAGSSDIILISDCDEIPRRETIAKITEILETDPSTFASCEQEMYQYYMNSPITLWFGTVCATKASLDLHSPQELRDLRCSSPHPLKNGGWHFAYMGGDLAIKYKLASFSHAELTGKEKELIEQFKKQPIVPIDETFPEYVQQHEEELTAIGYIKRVE